jgi:hypothetical protein
MNSTGLVACKTGTAVVDRLPHGLAYVANLEHGDHAALFYDNLVVAAEYFCAYVEEGICRNETTCFIGSSRALYETLFEQVGIKAASLENCGYLTYRPLQDFHLESEQSGSSKLLRSIQDCLSTSLKAGSSGMRFVILTGSLSGHLSGLDLLEFERSIGTCSPYPLSILCCYDARRVLEAESKLFTELVKAHGHCVFQGMAMPTSTLVGIGVAPSIGLMVQT